MTLTARGIEKMNRPGRFSDGRGTGLQLLVKPTGAKSWVQRLTIEARRVDRGLGGYPAYTLTEARTMAAENMRTVRRGGDPWSDRRPKAPTFAEAMERAIAIHGPTWTNESQERQWRASLRDYALPKLGKMPVDRITTADVLAVLMPIWHVKHTTATRVRQRISTIMLWAVAQGFRTDDPAGASIGAALPKNGARQAHHAAVPHQDVAQAIRKIREDANRSAAFALEFMILTATRSGEARGARWEEIDLDARVWTIPAARMKANREHRIPLSEDAIELLEVASRLSDGSGLVFPSARKGVSLPTNSFKRSLDRAGIEATAHGFRSSFRDWCGETEVDREVAEAALAHTIRNAVEAAYARSDLFERRRKVMEDWALYTASNVK